MLDITRDDLTRVLQEVGLPADRTGRIIGVLEVSLARQAARTKDRILELDERARAELEEALRIGGGVSPADARRIVAGVVSLVSQRAVSSALCAAIKGGEAMFRNERTPNKVERVMFLDEGRFEVGGGTVKFRPTE